MQAISVSYNEIVNYFGADKIADRYRYICEKMQEYIQIRGLEEKLYVHTGLLQQVVMDYYTDIYRMKIFHKIEKTDMAKILAYEIYWTVRRKPIQAMPGEDDSQLLFANEGFCVTQLAHDMLLPTGNEPLTPAENEEILALLQSFYYHLKYRNLDKQNLELMLQSFKAGQKIRE